MPEEEKPYRVYRGGRTKGKVPAPSGPGRGRRAEAEKPATGARYRGPNAKRALKRVAWRRWLPIGFAVLLVLFVVWGVFSYLAIGSGVSDANDRLPADARAALAKQSGLLLQHSTTILVLGTDNSNVAGRTGDDHSDSIQLVRTDPSHHRIAYLSIPRDLRVPIPGAGDEKINAAMQIGGPALAIKTVSEFTGIPVDHVIVVNFGDFKDLIDAVGGVTIDVPKPILSNRFDCPYATAQKCQAWPGWRFRKGSQHMNGERALIYSRVRENLLDPSENDLTREARQQAVTDAVMSKLTSPFTLAKLPFDGKSFVKPLATDLSAWQLIQLGWVKFRAGNGSALHCRLGGDGDPGGTTDIIPNEDDRSVIAMFTGQSAPQPPPPATDTERFPPGCDVGHVLQSSG
jgi:LCP family protein required for cell wall assembly